MVVPHRDTEGTEEIDRSDASPCLGMNAGIASSEGLNSVFSVSWWFNST